MKVYLDIDGVILANEKFAAEHSDEFIEYLVKNHDVYWLTTHCQAGDPAWACELVSRYLKPETAKLLKQIKPTSWKVLKTEAIDFSKPFVWLDDDVFEEDIEVLKQHGALKSWIEVDLSKDPEQLKKIIDGLRSR